jgi:hypothetical protein
MYLFKRLCSMTNIYATKVVEGRNTKGGVNWTKFIVFRLKVFINILIFMVVKKISHIKLQWFDFCKIHQWDYVTRSMFEDITICVHLVDNNLVIHILRWSWLWKNCKYQMINYGMQWVVWGFLECKAKFVYWWNDGKVYWEILAHSAIYEN